jgi:uncharacterized protein
MMISVDCICILSVLYGQMPDSKKSSASAGRSSKKKNHQYPYYSAVDMWKTPENAYFVRISGDRSV